MTAKVSTLFCTSRVVQQDKKSRLTLRQESGARTRTINEKELMLSPTPAQGKTVSSYPIFAFASPKKRALYKVLNALINNFYYSTTTKEMVVRN